MTKILSISDQNFLETNVGVPRIKDVTIENIGTDNVLINSVEVDNPNFIVSGKFPQMTNQEISYVDTTQYYFDENGYVVDTDDGTGIKAGIGNSENGINLNIKVTSINKYQILSEDCDISIRDACTVSTDKIAIHGYVYNIGTSAKVGGISIPNTKTYCYIIICLDSSDFSVEWLKYDFNMSEFGVANCVGDTICADSNYLYSVFSSRADVSPKVYFSRVSIDGTTHVVTEVKSSMQAWGWESICQSGNYVYICYTGTSGSLQLFNINKTGWVVGSDYNTGRPRNSFGIFTDGSYIYLGCSLDVSLSSAQVVRFNLINFSGSALITSRSATPPETYAIWTGANFATVNTVADVLVWATAEGTSTSSCANNPTTQGIKGGSQQAINTNSSGKIWNCEDNIIQRIHNNSTSVGDRKPTLRRLNNLDLATDWTVDYTLTKDMDVLSAFLCSDSRYMFVGETTGNFDGNNPTNTKRCAVFGVIDITDGDIGS